MIKKIIILLDKQHNMKKFLRFLLVLILILVVAFVVLGLIAKKDYHIERSIIIKAPKEVVFRQMVEYKNWPNWSPWYEMEPTMKIEYKEPDGQVGSGYHWTGKDMGEGEITTTEIQGTTMKCAMRFIKPFKAEPNSYFKAEDAGNGETKVTWGFDNRYGFAMSAFMMAFNMEKKMIKNFDRGLELMKKHVESHPAEAAAPASNVMIQQVSYPGNTYAVVRKKMGWGELDAFFSKTYEQLGKAMQSDIRGNAAALFYEWDEKNHRTDVAAGFPVDKSAAGKGGASLASVESSPALLAVHKGGYASSAAEHEALGKEVTAKGKERKLVIEEYVVGPGSEKDSTKWVTNIYYLMK